MNAAQSFPVSTSSDNEILADKISRLAAHIHAATYRFLVLVQEFDERDAWVETGSRSCAHWLNWRCGISLHTAREKLRVAHALKGLQKISAAFERGELSYSKVRLLTRIAYEDNEEVLLNIALSGTASQLERVVRCEIRCEREAEFAARSEAAHMHREFSWHTAADGSVEFFGRLPAELAEHVIRAIEANLSEPAGISDNLKKSVPAGTSGEGSEHNSTENSTINYTGNSKEHSKKNSANNSKEHHEQKPTGNSKEHPEENSTSNSVEHSEEKSRERACEPSYMNFDINPDDKPSLAMRRADALVALCSSRCEGYEVSLHVPAGTSWHANSLENAGTIPMKAAKRICCDAAFLPVTADDTGQVLDIGRRTRKIPPSIRRALQIRDKGCCRFPGCTHTHFLNGHHIRHWADGGPTSLDNLVLLCSHHHRLVHEGGFSCKAINRQGASSVNIVFKTPSGVIIPDTFALAPTDHRLEAGPSSLDIKAYTCAARDMGTPLDVDTVIDALAFRKRRESKQER